MKNDFTDSSQPGQKCFCVCVCVNHRAKFKVHSCWSDQSNETSEPTGSDQNMKEAGRYIWEQAANYYFHHWLLIFLIDDWMIKQVKTLWELCCCVWSKLSLLTEQNRRDSPNWTNWPVLNLPEERVKRLLRAPTVSSRFSSNTEV